MQWYRSKKHKMHEVYIDKGLRNNNVYTIVFTISGTLLTTSQLGNVRIEIMYIPNPFILIYLYFF